MSTPAVILIFLAIVAVIVAALYGIPAYQRRKRKHRYRRKRD